MVDSYEGVLEGKKESTTKNSSNTKSICDDSDS